MRSSDRTNTQPHLGFLVYCSTRKTFAQSPHLEVRPRRLIAALGNDHVPTFACPYDLIRKQKSRIGVGMDVEVNVGVSNYDPLAL